MKRPILGFLAAVLLSIGLVGTTPAWGAPAPLPSAETPAHHSDHGHDHGSAHRQHSRHHHDDGDDDDHDGRRRRCAGLVVVCLL